MSSRWVEVLAAGPLTTVQDLGRPGFATLGVPRSGAFDRAAARLANRLVGNPEGAGVLEVTLGGVELAFPQATTVALTGAACPGFAHGTAVSLAAGMSVRLGRPSAGLRSYLAVRGGIVVAPALGSRSTDLLSGLGPPALRAGDRLPLGSPHPGSPPSGAAVGALPVANPAVLPAVIGPRDDWFASADVRRLTDPVWAVRPDSDRIGVRLDGPPLRRVVDAELPSEPTLPGAVQVPPDGRPIVFGPDGPVTGGYPVVAVITEAGLDLAAQLRPGAQVRFALQYAAQVSAGRRMT